MAELPDGLNTFLFTDIAGSTRRWGERPDAMRTALSGHDALVQEAIESREGQIFKTVGDAFHAVFVSAPAAVRAALAIQHAMQSFDWSLVGSLEVRVALYTGAAELRENDYFGTPINRLA